MPKNDDKLADFLKETWGKRAEGIPVHFDITRPPSHDDVLYMLRRYPFVQIINSAPNQELSNEIRFIRTKSNWVIFDYETAMCTSLGDTLFGNERYQKDEQGNYQRLNTGTGTISKQIVDTSTEMVIRAQKKGWERIHIVAGESSMKWAIWAAAKKLGIEVTGYIPSTEVDIPKFNRIKDKFDAIIEPILSKLKLKPK